jgi:hypothetical protein
MTFLITGNDTEKITWMTQQLEKVIEMSMLGKLSRYLGVDFKHTDKGIFMTQQHFINDMLETFEMIECKASKTPMDIGTHLKVETGIALIDPVLYHRMVGKLL